jgi:hypothetical protein
MNMFFPQPSQDRADPASIPIYFSMVVWGSAFTSFFLEFCLPSLLADRNIPVASKRPGSKFVLHTRPSDLAAIERSPAFALLKEKIAVDIRLIDFEIRVPHDALSRCHRETMNLADADQVPAVFLSPDTIWSNGSIETVDRVLCSGKRVVFLWSMRLVKEDAEPFIRAVHGTGERTVLDLGPRELNKLALKFLHPTIQEYFFEPGTGNKLSPMVLLWPLPNGDILAHAFHQHPLLVYPRKRFASFAQTIDGDLVYAACPDPRDHYVIRDTDEIIAIELSKLSHFMPGMYEKRSSQDVAAWAVNQANSVHWSLFPVPIRMHSNAIEEGEWHSAEDQARRVVSAILTYRRRRRIPIFIRRSFEGVLARILGMDRAGVKEWTFRRRHAISFFLREKTFRGKHAVSFFFRNKVFRGRHAVSHAIRRGRHVIRMFPSRFVIAIGRVTKTYSPSLHRVLQPTVAHLRRTRMIS